VRASKFLFGLKHPDQTDKPDTFFCEKHEKHTLKEVFLLYLKDFFQTICGAAKPRINILIISRVNAILRRRAALVFSSRGATLPLSGEASGGLKSTLFGWQSNI
jgi:hypothetical protein